MKKKLAMLFVVIMILSCMPVMAATVPAGKDAAAADDTVEVQASRTGWVKVGKYYRYYYAAGKYYKNCVKKIENKLFGFSPKGNLCCRWFTINNVTYYASVKSGAKGIGVGQILTGYRKIGNDYYYLDPQKSGARTSGFVKVGAKLYYFSPANGKQRRTKGWFFVGNFMYYVQADGSIATNKTIDGYKIGANGRVADPYGYDKKAQGYSSSTRYLILVDKSRHLVNFYQGSKGNWVNIKRNILCTIGKKATPTRSGNFKLSLKVTKNGKYGRKDFKSATAFYAFRINAGNFFHSVLYRLGCSNPYTNSPKDATLGKNKSNGCIRLPLADAKFIWDNMKRGTRVIVW
jgi:hypothetical protein